MVGEAILHPGDLVAYTCRHGLLSFWTSIFPPPTGREIRDSLVVGWGFSKRETFAFKSSTQIDATCCTHVSSCFKKRFGRLYRLSLSLSLSLSLHTSDGLERRKIRGEREREEKENLNRTTLGPDGAIDF